MVIEESILIRADIHKVWKTFTDLTCWNNWNTVMRNVCSDEKCIATGSKVRCSFHPLFFPVKAEIKVEEVMPYESIVWSAKKRGFSARNRFSFQRQEKGVFVTSRETFTGFIVRGFGFFLPVKKMRSMIATFLKDLKRASES